MANLSIRGLDDDALAKLKARAIKEDASVNTLVLRLIEQGLGQKGSKHRRTGRRQTQRLQRFSTIQSSISS